MSDFEINCKGEKLLLLPEKAVYWPAQKTLVLADMHLGKTAYFRSSGIQIPAAVMQADLHRLDAIIGQFAPEKIVVAGDMFHHDYNSDVALFKTWREKHSAISFILVPGNHDKLLHIDYAALQIITTGPVYREGPFLFIHHHDDVPADGFVISGHVHPGYYMEGKARQSHRFPCFVIKEDHLLLPAFSDFTGLYTKHEGDNNQYYLIGPGKVFAL